MNRFVSLSGVWLLLAGSTAWGQHNDSSVPGVYQVDAENSDIRVLVHRAGVLSRLGHNHVISVAQLEGTIYVYPELEQSHFNLLIPVQDLVVDNPLLRHEEGADFATEPAARDIARTRKNMLGKKVLNAAQYPTIVISGTGPRFDGPEAVLDLSMQLLGGTFELPVAATLQLNGDVLEVAGAFRLKHSDLGLRPFSALLGAIQVADEIKIKYRVRAQRKSAAGDQDP